MTTIARGMMEQVMITMLLMMTIETMMKEKLRMTANTRQRKKKTYLNLFYSVIMSAILCSD